MNERDEISVRDAARKVRQRAEDRSVTNNLYTLLRPTLVVFGARVMPTGQVTRALALLPPRRRGRPPAPPPRPPPRRGGPPPRASSWTPRRPMRLGPAGEIAREPRGRVITS